jgi:transcriptional regulator with XRE-family HTH domain
MKSTQPFAETFERLRELQGISQREVARRAANHGAPGFPTLNRVFRGETRPLPVHLKAVAAALGVAPETFAEYRLWQVVHAFDIVGDERRQLEPITFKQAMHNLARYEEVMGKATDTRAEDPHDPAEVAAALADPRGADAATGERS